MVGPLMDRASDALMGQDDTGAKIAIGIGTFIVVSDLSYRATKIKITIPEAKSPGLLKDLKDPIAWGSLIAAGPVGLGGYEIYKHWDYASSLYNTVMPRIDLSSAQDPDAGLWDIKITTIGMGLVAAGVALWIANHPEIVLEGVKFVKGAVRETLDITEKAILKQIETSGPNSSTDNLTKALSILPAVL